ncbi:MAG: hypothetical protein WCI72_06170 [archaeon]
METQNKPQTKYERSQQMIEKHLANLGTDDLKLGYLSEVLDHKRLTSRETKKAINTYMCEIHENQGNFYAAAQNAKRARQFKRAKDLLGKYALKEEEKGNYIHASGAVTAWLEAGNPRRAAILCEKAPGYIGYLAAARAWEEAGDLEKAAENLERTGNENYFEKAQNLWERVGKSENSIAALKKGKGPQAAAEVLYERKVFDVAGQLWEEAGDLEKAAKSYFEYSQNRDTNCPDEIAGHSIKWDIAFNLLRAGKIWADMGKKDLSVLAYTQAAEMYEQSSTYFGHRNDRWEAADCWKRAGQKGKAEAIQNELSKGRDDDLSLGDHALGSAMCARMESEDLTRCFSNDLERGNMSKDTLQSYLSEIEGSRMSGSVPGVQLAIKICSLLGDNEKVRNYLTMLKDSYYLQDNGMMYKVYLQKLARFEKECKKTIL